MKDNVVECAQIFFTWCCWVFTVKSIWKHPARFPNVLHKSWTETPARQASRQDRDEHKDQNEEDSEQEGKYKKDSENRQR